MNSAFVRFRDQIAAHLACQSIVCRIPGFMAPRYIEVALEDVIWENTCLTRWERSVRTLLSNAALTVLIVFYVVPTAFIGSVSNVTYLTGQCHWLRWVYSLPSKFTGIITGLFPSLILSIWLGILPTVLHAACKWQGHLTQTAVDLRVQDMYFAFLVRFL